MKKKEIFTIAAIGTLAATKLIKNKRIALKEGDKTLKQYYKAENKKWVWKNYEYDYLLKINGLVPNTLKEVTYIYLSNLSHISFYQAHLSATKKGRYFNENEAVLVDIIYA